MTIMILIIMIFDTPPSELSAADAFNNENQKKTSLGEV